MEEGNVVSIPIRRDAFLRLRFTLKGPGQQSIACVDLLAPRAATQRILALRRTKEDLRKEIEDMRHACTRRPEADTEPERLEVQVRLAEQAELQKELEKNLQLRSRFLAIGEMLDKARVEDMAQLKGLFDELVDVRRRAALVRGGVDAQRQFLRDIQTQHEAIRQVLLASESKAVVLRGELRASRMEVDAEHRSSTKRRAIVASLDETIGRATTPFP